MARIGKYLVVALAAIAVSACASMNKTTKQRQVASVLSYLYPGTEQAPPVSDQVAEIKVPFRIGVAFVPDNTNAEFRLPETDRIMLADKVGEAFKRYPFVADIVAVPLRFERPPARIRSRWLLTWNTVVSTAVRMSYRSPSTT